MPKLFLVIIVLLLITACVTIGVIIKFVDSSSAENSTWQFIQVVFLGVVGAGLGMTVVYTCVALVTILSH